MLSCHVYTHHVIYQRFNHPHYGLDILDWTITNFLEEAMGRISSIIELVELTVNLIDIANHRMRLHLLATNMCPNQKSL